MNDEHADSLDDVHNDNDMEMVAYYYEAEQQQLVESAVLELVER